MLYLNTDEQTLEDIGIFGRSNGRGIYDIYNRSHTRGGETLLGEMFRHPLSNPEAINQRSRIIEHFARLEMAFPFEADLFDTTEKYLKNPEDNSRSAAGQGMLSDKEIQNGVTAVLTLVRQIRNFLQSGPVTGLDAWAGERAAMLNLLNDPVLEPVLREHGNGRLPFTAVAAYDVLFRVRERARIAQLLKHIYLFDVYLSVAIVAREKKFIFPKALEKGSAILILKGVWHPELPKPVSNNLSLNPGQNLIFLTGANMAGKSTFLRSVSTAVYLAHMGFPVAASSMEFSVMDGIYTTINLPDNLGIGASHFYAEVLRVKKVATELSRGLSLFIIFDELFRGTNVKDAQEATILITAAFAAQKNSQFIISSHIVEAGETLKQQDGVGFRFLPTRMKGHVPEYTYTLEEGITDDRHGMIIIRNEGILDTLKNGRKD